MTAHGDNLLIGQSLPRLISFVITVDSHNRRTCAELIQHPQLTHVARVQYHVNAVENTVDDRGQVGETQGHVGVGNKPKCGNDPVGKQVGRQQGSVHNDIVDSLCRSPPV